LHHGRIEDFDQSVHQRRHFLGVMRTLQNIHNEKAELGTPTINLRMKSAVIMRRPGLGRRDVQRRRHGRPDGGARILCTRSINCPAGSIPPFGRR
jgi:hypothetical protein